MHLWTLIISALTTVVVAQEPFLNCTYRLNEVYYYIPYRCDVTINNPNGFNNFTEIGGTHLDGFTNEDVGYVYRVSGVSANIPSIVCDTFPNLEEFFLHSVGLTEIDESTLRGCSRITLLNLNSNRIASISSNAFLAVPNIISIYLHNNSLTTLPADVFTAQRNLFRLDISYNPFQDIPDALFRPLENIQYINLGNTNITAINNQWFDTNKRLYSLHLPMNRINLTTDAFVGLASLGIVDLSSNELNGIPVEVLALLPNLQVLHLTDNNITEFQPGSFSNLGRLSRLNISSNPIEIIPKGAFEGLVSLSGLVMANCRLRRIESYYFEDLGNLTSLSLKFNQIEDIAEGVFASMPNLDYIELLSNRLKTLRRNSFGSLTKLYVLDLDGNIVNAMDRAIIDDAVNLYLLYFSRNLCANGYFLNFQNHRDLYLPALERCFRNMGYIVETVTEGDAEFSFFEAPNAGIALRVNTVNEIQIALTPFEFFTNPVIEVIIGSTNNTRSIIRMNQETNVVNAATPNIIARDQWNDFRITWANQLIQVFSGNNTLPFMGYYMQDLFPINFYGLRAVETNASWSIQPFE